MLEVLILSESVGGKMRKVFITPVQLWQETMRSDTWPQQAASAYWLPHIQLDNFDNDVGLMGRCVLHIYMQIYSI